MDPKALVMRLPAILLAATIAALPTGTASAADLDYGFGNAPPPVVALPESKVEFGSGWYVRGDIGATAIPAISPNTPAIPSSSSGVFVDDAPTISLRNSHQLGYTASLGAGYSFNRWFRADGVFDYHQAISANFNGSPFACQNGYGLVPATTTTTTQDGVSTSNTTAAYSYKTYGSCTGTYKASLSSYDVLFNGYVDIGHWYGFTPYVGAGVGLSFGHYSTSARYTQADGSSYNINVTEPVSGTSYHLYYDRFASGSYTNFAFALMAGVAYDIYPHTKLDLGYRYIHLGSVLGQDLTTQEARVGLRYMIDN